MITHLMSDKAPKLEARDDEAQADALDVGAVSCTGARTTVSISTRESIKVALERVAGDCNVSPHSVAHYAIRFFLAHYAQGTSGIANRVVPPKKTRNSIDFG